MQKILNKVIWITGASSGIGEACAYLFAEKGARLILTATKVDKLKNVKSKCIELGGNCEILPYDLADIQGIDKLVENATEFLNTVIKLKPQGLKGSYVKSIFLSSTMSPGINIDSKAMNAAE